MDLRESIKNQTDVSLQLTKHVALKHAKDSNLVYSPLSIHVILSLIAAGSEGETLDQLLSFLRSKSNADLNSLSSELVGLVLADGTQVGGPKISFANGVWIEKALNMKDSFKQVVQNVYKASSNQVDFKTKRVVPFFHSLISLSLWKFTSGDLASLSPDSDLRWFPVVGGGGCRRRKVVQGICVEMGKYTCYVVLKGRKIGVYSTWEECKAQVDYYPGASYKGCYSEEEAIEALSRVGVVGGHIRTTTYILKELKRPEVGEHSPPPSTFVSPLSAPAKVDGWKFVKDLIGLLLVALIALVVISVVVKVYLL